RSPRSRPHLQPMTEQDEDEKHRRCFIELVAFEKKGSANAEDVARPDAEEDQHRHVENSVPECPDGSDDERPGGIEDCRAGEKEQPEVESQPEGRRRWNKHVAHGRVDEDRHCEHETDPEAVAHVSHHGLHVHAGTVAHLVRHVVRHRHSGCCRSGGRGRFVRGVTDMHAVLVEGTWFADMLGHHLAGAVEAALVDLGLERRHTSDGLIILDCHAVRGDAGGRALDPGYRAELLLDGLVVLQGQHAANVKSRCFHASLLSLMSADLSAFSLEAASRPFGSGGGSHPACKAHRGHLAAACVQFSYWITPVCRSIFSRCTSELSTVTMSAVMVPSSLLSSPSFSRLLLSRSRREAR